MDLLADMGAYLMLVTPGVPLLGAFMYPAIYKMDAYSFKCTGVFTTKMPTDAYRGAGRPEATFAIERIMDELAAELGVDPLEVRERNWIKHEEFPYTTIASLHVRLGQLRGRHGPGQGTVRLRRAAAEQAERNLDDDPVRLGIGVSTFTEMCGLAPSRVLGSLAYGAGGWEHASIRMLPTGKVEVVTGSSAHGQGHETAWSQIVADAARRAVRGHPGAARRHPGLAQGHGHLRLAFPHRRRHGPGRRVRQGDREGQADRRPHAGGQRERHRVHRPAGSRCAATRKRATPSRRSRWPRSPAHDLPDGIEPSLDSDATYDPDNFSFPHGTHLCAVEVDTETGMVTIRSYVAVDDIGKVVNPLIVEGQVHGGLAQGIAQALYEEAVYDDDGNLITTTLADYLVPSAADLPSYVTDRTETPAANRARREGRRRGGHDRVHARRWSTRSSTRSGRSASGTSRCRARRSGSGGAEYRRRRQAGNGGAA